MKNSKKIFIALSILFFIVFSKLYSQIPDIHEGEFMIVNQTGLENGYYLIVKIFPVGAIFSGGGQYTVDAKWPIDEQQGNKYIFGRIAYLSNDPGNVLWTTIANFDKTSDRDYCSFSLGYGKYRINFYRIVGGYEQLLNWGYVDFNDANFGKSEPGYYQKIRVDFCQNEIIKYNYIDDNGNNFPQQEIIDHDTIKVWEQLGTPNPLTRTSDKGNFNDTVTYHSYPIDATELGLGAIGHENPDLLKLNLKIKYQGANILPDKELNFNNCIFAINDDIIFTINGGSNQNPIMTVSGSGAKLISGNNSKLFFPENYQVKIFNHAIIESNGTKFQVGTGLPIWKGIYLENSGALIDNNCEFENSINSIYSTNSGANFIKIANSKITVPSINSEDLCTGVYFRKAHNYTIYNNDFILPIDFINYITTGFACYNNSTSETENNDAPWQSINIVGNRFSDGCEHIGISCLGDALTSVNIKNNHFQNGQINMLLVNVYGRISENEIISNCDCGTAQVNPNIFLLYSSPNFLNNYNIEGNCNNIYLAAFCYPNFAPRQLPEHQFFWNAGLNNFTSHRYDNIWTPEMNDFSAKFSVEWGKNVFKSYSSSRENMFGYLNTTSTVFNATGNCWNDDDVPQCSLFNLKNELMQVQFDINCNWSENIVENIITDMGNGIYDTIYITQSNNIPSPPVDVALYSTGVKNQELKNYSSSINNLKNLINTYPYSKNLEKSIFNLFECYVASDTNHNQGWRNIIFSDLKNYLENKIQQYDTNENFVNVAFDFLLRSNIKLKNYQQAMDGYEFIAENSPSAIIRLMASINYLDVEGLLQGSGGGEKDNENKFEELNKSQSPKPIKDILLVSYKKTNKSISEKEKSDLQNSSDVSKTRTELTKKHAFDKKLENRAKENISISSSLTKEERRERIQKDLMLLTQRGETSEKIVKKNNLEPLKYELLQNYPNPFNPVTRINYSIPKQGLVTLRIYDILGREIKILVNEVKSQGNYIVDFNGSNLASGIYFYRIQAGSFVQVKRMVLIK